MGEGRRGCWNYTHNPKNPKKKHAGCVDMERDLDLRVCGGGAVGAGLVGCLGGRRGGVCVCWGGTHFQCGHALQ